MNRHDDGLPPGSLLFITVCLIIVLVVEVYLFMQPVYRDLRVDDVVMMP